MRVDKKIRDAMLVTLGDIIEAAFGEAAPTDRNKVEFFDLAGDLLCELEFDSVDPISTGADKAIVRLKSIDGSYILKGTASGAGLPGTVDSYKILCKVGSDVDYYLTGSVGTLTSSAELRFNIVSWVEGTFISIENFDIIIPNGV